MSRKSTPSTARARRAFLETSRWQFATIICIALAAYWNSLSGGFHFDDQGILLDPYIVSTGFGLDIFRLAQTRPLTFLTFHWNYLAGSGPYEFHAVNVLLHAASSGLVLLIARRVLPGKLPLIAAAIFAVHPLQSQAVNYVFERATLLAAFFALISVFLFLREQYTWSVIAFVLSLLAKEETAALPLFLLLYDAARRRRRIYHGAMFLAAGLAAARLFYALAANHESQLGFATRGVSVPAYALTQCRVVLDYLALFVFPFGLNLDHDVALSIGAFSPATTLPALCLILLIIGILAFLARRGTLAALWALGFFILLAPSSSVVPVSDLMFEHRVYFPLACLAIALAAGAARLPLPAAAAMVAALVVLTIARNEVWHDDISLWTDVIEKSPRKARGYFQLGQAYASADPARARQLYERGLELEPRNPAGRMNLGLVLMSQGDLESALARFREALEYGGDQPAIWNNIGVARVHGSELGEGISAFRRALAANPCRFDARMNLARTFFAANRQPEALSAAGIPSECKLLPWQIRQLQDERRAIEASGSPAPRPPDSKNFRRRS